MTNEGRTQPRCAEHPTAAANQRCNSCGAWLCLGCWKFNIDGAPWCASCVAMVEREKDRFPLSFALTCILVGLGLTVAGVRRGLFDYFWASVVVVIVALIATAVARSLRGEPSLVARHIVEVSAGKPAQDRRKLADTVRRVVRTVIPSLSGRATVLVVVTCFALAAALVPAALKLPRVVEIEIVLVTWWIVLWATLTRLLYRGSRIGDDFRYRIRVPSVDSLRESAKPPGRAGQAIGRGCDVGGCLDLDGCAVVLAGVVIALVAATASWLLLEVAFPTVFLLVYLLLRGALARVTNDAHECYDHLPRSLAWGLFWSAVYTAPVALVVWLVHLALARP